MGARILLSQEILLPAKAEGEASSVRRVPSKQQMDREKKEEKERRRRLLYATGEREKEGHSTHALSLLVSLSLVFSSPPQHE
eukprot:scaffold2094_cov32-Tisochrysis_lutea.AAC.1